MSDVIEDIDDGRQNVWVIYNDRMKDLDDAKRYGRLREMFTGIIDYTIVVQQAIKMFDGKYKEGDFLLVVGDPKIVGVVTTVAEKYFSKEGTIRLLCWNKRKLAYYPETVNFPDPEIEEEGPAEVIYGKAANNR